MTSHLSANTPPAATGRTPTIFWWTLAILVAAALVPTVWSELDLRAAGVFAGPGKVLDSVQWGWVEWINFQIPTVFRWMVLLALMGWIFCTVSPYGKQWRLQLAFLVLAGTLGPGLVVNLGFKDQWQRARPYQVEQFGGVQQFTRAAVITDQCESNCSFVSGHVACGFFIVGLMLIDPRRKVAWAVTGVSAGLLIGFSRMSDAAHWLSDVLWAGPITLLCSWLVWKMLLHMYDHKRLKP